MSHPEQMGYTELDLICPWCKASGPFSVDLDPNSPTIGSDTCQSCSRPVVVECDMKLQIRKGGAS